MMSALDSVECPSCKSNSLIVRGEIPEIAHFAGISLTRPLCRTLLIKCESCSLEFKFPRLKKEDLDGLYRRINIDAWQYSLATRPDWDMAVALIRNHCSTGLILDVGCFDGQFLDYLPNYYQKYGIEMNDAAIRKAQQRGLQIIGSDFHHLKSRSEHFDVIVATDIIEHAENPLSFMQILSDSLTAGGMLIVSTGNSKAISWKLMGSRYWYCSLPEHISFVNDAWLKATGRSLGLRVEYLSYFSHNPSSIMVRTKEMAQNLVNYVCALFPVCYTLPKRLKRSLLNRKDVGVVGLPQPPMWKSATDHLIVAYVKE